MNAPDFDVPVYADDVIIFGSMHLNTKNNSNIIYFLILFILFFITASSTLRNDNVIYAFNSSTGESLWNISSGRINSFYIYILLYILLY